MPSGSTSAARRLSASSRRWIAPSRRCPHCAATLGRKARYRLVERRRTSPRPGAPGRSPTRRLRLRGRCPRSMVVAVRSCCCGERHGRDIRSLPRGAGCRLLRTRHELHRPRASTVTLTPRDARSGSSRAACPSRARPSRAGTIPWRAPHRRRTRALRAWRQ